METIILKNFGLTLNTRPLADEIFKNAETGTVVIDFEGVEAATPSFCHEMLFILIKEKKGRPSLINVNSDIENQLKKAYFVLLEGASSNEIKDL